MDKNFFKIKSKHVLRVALESVVIGAACGLFAMGVVMLALKLSAINFATWGYALIAVAIALVAFGVAFALLKPNNKKVAKAVDDEYDLKEKVQTALEFQGASGEVITLQREDADRSIRHLPAHRPNIRQVMALVLVLIVSLSSAFAGIFVPLKIADAVDDPYDRPPTRFETLAILELIENVKSSNLIEPYKGDALKHLQNIADELEEFDNVSEVMPTIETAIAQIGGGISRAKEYDKFATTLLEQKFTELSIAARSADIYDKQNLSSYDLVVAFEASLIEMLNAEVEPEIEALRESYAGITGAQIASEIRDMCARIEIAASVLDDRGLLYSAEEQFRHSLLDIRDDILSGSAEEGLLQHRIDLIFYDFTDQMIDALAEQSYTQAMGVFIVNRIKIIFGMPIEENKPNDSAGNKEDLPSAGGDDDESHGGGYGDGDIVYGSDDMIYDPNTGKYVTYGDLLNQYFAMMQEFVGKDELTEAQKEIVRYYFEILFSGIKEAEN